MEPRDAAGILRLRNELLFGDVYAMPASFHPWKTPRAVVIP
jgi:hypothetical protein